jgi:hypothetical protein
VIATWRWYFHLQGENNYATKCCPKLIANAVRDLRHCQCLWSTNSYVCNEYVAVIHILLLFTCCYYSHVAVFTCWCYSRIVIHVLLLLTCCRYSHVAVIHKLPLFTCCYYSRIAVILVLLLFTFWCYSHVAIIHVLVLFTCCFYSRVVVFHVLLLLTCCCYSQLFWRNVFNSFFSALI